MTSTTSAQRTTPAPAGGGDRPATPAPAPPGDATSGRPSTGDTGWPGRARLLWTACLLVLTPVAGIGACLSFQSLYRAAKPIFGPLAIGYPLLADMLILGATLAFLAGATSGRALAGWRWTAHGGVAATLALNCASATTPSSIPWHITPPLVWAVLVEMTARQVTSTWPSAGCRPVEPIPSRLWLTRPLDSARTWLHMARTLEPSHRCARAELAVQDAALLVLRLTLPGRRYRMSRRLLRKQLRAGVLAPTDALDLARRLHGQPLHRQSNIVVIQALLSQTPEQPGRHHDDALTQDRATPQRTPARLRDRSLRARPDLNHEVSGEAGDVPGPHAEPITRLADKPRAAIESMPSEDDDADETTGKSLDPAPEGKLLQEGQPGRQPGTAQEGRGRRATAGSLSARAEAVSAIVRSRPGIDGPALAEELAQQGWQVSKRTARRILSDQTTAPPI